MKTFCYCLIKNLLFIAAIFVETCLARIFDMGTTASPAVATRVGYVKRFYVTFCLIKTAVKREKRKLAFFSEREQFM